MSSIPTKADEYFFLAVAEKYAGPRYIRIILLAKKYESAIYWKESGLYILPLHERERSPINWSYDVT